MMTMMCVCVLNRDEERHNPENRSFQMHVEGGHSWQKEHKAKTVTHERTSWVWTGTQSSVRLNQERGDCFLV